MVAEIQGDATTGYLRGVNLISKTADTTEYYLFNAHGDVVNLVNSTGTTTKTYDYDSFGKERNPDSTDENPFRYCGEYYDTETGTYYLRARYYDPALGRFTQADTHWNTANMIYGDNPQKINEREDKLGLKSYSYAPQITAIMQAGNLYVYCKSSPIAYIDPSGLNTLSGSPPPVSSGYVPPKGLPQSSWWDSARKGWKDKYGNIWVPDKYGHGKDHFTGESDHWDVQRGDGNGYINVGKNGKRWGGKEKKPNLPDPPKIAKDEAPKTNKNETPKTNVVSVVQQVVEVIVAPAVIAGAWIPFPITVANLR